MSTGRNLSDTLPPRYSIKSCSIRPDFAKHHLGKHPKHYFQSRSPERTTPMWKLTSWRRNRVCVSRAAVWSSRSSHSPAARSGFDQNQHREREVKFGFLAMRTKRHRFTGARRRRHCPEHVTRLTEISHILCPHSRHHRLPHSMDCRPRNRFFQSRSSARSSRTMRLSLASAFISAVIFFTACMTVVWSRPPK